MPGSIQFTYARLQDLEKIVSTYNASIPGKLATADLEPVAVESKLDWFHAHTEGSRPLWLIHSEGNYAGWMSFSSFYGRPAYDKTIEVSIYIQPALQGKGIGKACLRFAEEEARKRNIITLLGFIFGHNGPSLNLFYKQGYEKWAHLPAIADMEGTWRDLIIVGKKVA